MKLTKQRRGCLLSVGTDSVPVWIHTHEGGALMIEAKAGGWPKGISAALSGLDCDWSGEDAVCVSSGPLFRQARAILRG